MLAQIQLQGPSEEFQQHLEARLGNGRIVPALAELVADKGICPRQSDSVNNLGCGKKSKYV